MRAASIFALLVALLVAPSLATETFSLAVPAVHARRCTGLLIRYRALTSGCALRRVSTAITVRVTGRKTRKRARIELPCGKPRADARRMRRVVKCLKNSFGGCVCLPPEKRVACVCKDIKRCAFGAPVVTLEPTPVVTAEIVAP